MSAHAQPPSGRDPHLHPPPTPHGGSQPSINLEPDDQALVKMQHDFPHHRIWREIIPGRTVYVARSLHPTARPHTLVTPDLRELLTALTEAT